MKLKIWEKHTDYAWSDEQSDFIIVPLKGDPDWHKFTHAFDVDQIRIESYTEDVIFDKEQNPQPCIRVNFTNESFVFARYTLNAFDKLYNEVYLPMIPKSLGEIVDDLKGESG